MLIAAPLLATVVALNGNANWLEGAELLCHLRDRGDRVLVPVGRPPQPKVQRVGEPPKSAWSRPNAHAGTSRYVPLTAGSRNSTA